MKWSEIFRKAVARDDDSTASNASAPRIEAGEEQLPPINAPSDGKLPDEASATGENAPMEIVPFQPPRVPLPEGYVYPDTKEAAHIHAELLRELIPEHPLFGVPLQLFAASEDNQDALFQYRGNPSRFVLVHLTWIGRAEMNADHPGILFTGTFEEFLQREKELYGLEPSA